MSRFVILPCIFFRVCVSVVVFFCVSILCVNVFVVCVDVCYFFVGCTPMFAHWLNCSVLNLFSYLFVGGCQLFFGGNERVLLGVAALSESSLFVSLLLFICSMGKEK